MSRLSRRHRILFVETVGPDPDLIAPFAKLRAVEHFPNITLLRIQFPPNQWENGVWVDEQRRALVKAALDGPLAGQFERAVQWFYDPMAVTAFAGQLGERAIVYDCMDELSKFRGAPPELVKRELKLLGQADLVFTGGRKLHESKERYHGNCHFFGCGVDLEHFGRAQDMKTIVPPDLRVLPRPVLGYFGVVDERLDYDLLAKLAEANPRWSLAMIGPVHKVEERTLPRRPNLHWLGGRDYSQLPAYGKGFSVCLMPFALNDATEYINPTKALEYMATGRIVVSSAVPDVVRNFGSVVRIALDHKQFVAYCKEAVAEPDRGAIQRGLELALSSSWDSIIEQLEKQVDQMLDGKAARSLFAAQSKY